MRACLLANAYLNVVFDFPGFRLEYIHIDRMHVVCLGIAPVVLGNVLFELFREVGGVIARPNEALGKLMMVLEDAWLACQKTLTQNALTPRKL